LPRMLNQSSQCQLWLCLCCHQVCFRQPGNKIKMKLKLHCVMKKLGKPSSLTGYGLDGWWCHHFDQSLKYMCSKGCWSRVRCKVCKTVPYTPSRHLARRWGRVVSITPWSHFTPGKGPLVPIGQEAGWASELEWTQILEEKCFASAIMICNNAGTCCYRVLSLCSCYGCVLLNKKDKLQIYTVLQDNKQLSADDNKFNYHSFYTFWFNPFSYNFQWYFDLMHLVMTFHDELLKFSHCVAFCIQHHVKE
jgi:hypothetical protein